MLEGKWRWHSSSTRHFAKWQCWPQWLLEKCRLAASLSASLQPWHTCRIIDVDVWDTDNMHQVRNTDTRSSNVNLAFWTLECKIVFSTHTIPKQKSPDRSTFFFRFILSLHTTGCGRQRIRKSTTMLMLLMTIQLAITLKLAECGSHGFHCASVGLYAKINRHWLVIK